MGGIQLMLTDKPNKPLDEQLACEKLEIGNNRLSVGLPSRKRTFGTKALDPDRT